MKHFGLITSALLVVLVGTGLAYFILAKAGTPKEPEASRLARARARIAGEAKPVARLALPAGDELMDPERSLPFFQAFDGEELRRVASFAASCASSEDRPAADAALEKARLFAERLCGITAALPDGFFARPPFMHPTGKSYALLAAEAGIAAPADKRHVLERQGGELSRLTRDDLAALWRADPVVLTKDLAFVFVPRSSGKGDGGEYLAFPRAAWDSLIKTREVSPRLLQALALLALGATLLLASTLGIFALARLGEKRREREHHLFVVRALTHELRTPATSIGLTLEALRADFDRLPPSSQEAFLILSEQTQRLNRVIAGSTRYLKVDDARQAPTTLRTLPSLRQFFDSVLEPYQDKIVFEPLQGDRAFAIDPYLLQVCVQNLVENALRHGKPEVRVRVVVDGDRLAVDVVDQGELPAADVGELSAKAAYCPTKGLGLGLQVVAKIVKDLGGTLSLARFPATFTLRFKEAP